MCKPKHHSQEITAEGRHVGALVRTPSASVGTGLAQGAAQQVRSERGRTSIERYLAALEFMTQADARNHLIAIRRYVIGHRHKGEVEGASSTVPTDVLIRTLYIDVRAL